MIIKFSFTFGITLKELFNYDVNKESQKQS